MTTCIIAHSTVPSTRISRELVLTIGAGPSPLTCPTNLFFSRGREEGSIEEELALAPTRSRLTLSSHTNSCDIKLPHELPREHGLPAAHIATARGYET